MLSILLKSATSKLLTGLTYMVDHWRVFLPLLILCLMLWQYNRVTSQRDAAVTELAEYKAQIVQLANQRKAENIQKAIDANVRMRSVVENHAEEMETIRRIANDRLRAEKNYADRTINDLRNRLRNTIASGIGMPEIPSTTSRIAAGGTDSDTTVTGQEEYLESLEIGCAITTADFNALWNAWRQACDVYGCE